MCEGDVKCGDEIITDLKVIDKSKILTLLWGVCKKQQTQISTLETELDTVKSELDTYKSLMDKLMNATSFKSFKESIA